MTVIHRLRQEWPLDTGRKYTFGRLPTHDFYAPDQAISRDHGQLTYANDVWTYHDHSTYGTLLVGRGDNKTIVYFDKGEKNVFEFQEEETNTPRVRSLVARIKETRTEENAHTLESETEIWLAPRLTHVGISGDLHEIAYEKTGAWFVYDPNRS